MSLKSIFNSDSVRIDVRSHQHLPRSRRVGSEILPWGPDPEKSHRDESAVPQIHPRVVRVDEYWT